MAINNEQYLEQIKKEIESLHEKKIQIEQSIRKEKEEAEKKKKEEKNTELKAIENAIKTFNEKHKADADKLVLATEKEFNADSIYNLFPWW